MTNEEDELEQCLSCGELVEDPKLLAACQICQEPVCEDCWDDHMKQHTDEKG